MKFLVWADKYSKKLSPIINTAHLYGIDPMFIGIGTQLKSNLLFKISSLYEAACTLKDDEIVCCTDGFDVLYQDDEESIKKKFLSFNCDIVFSAEKAYSHQYKKYKKHFDSIADSSPYKYLNTGCVIGYAKSIQKMFETILSWKQKIRYERTLIVMRVTFPKTLYTIVSLGIASLKNEALKKTLKKIIADLFNYDTKA